jgi:acyl phosphate:glycerol-3-phosphate acyltransferase
VSGTWLFALCGLLAYLSGSVPFGLLIARARGVDIRKVGSGNIGATNVFRSVGRGAGVLTFLLDLLKGFVPAFLFPLLLRPALGPVAAQALSVLCACLAVAGHNWPIFLRFRGGKGVATSTGALLGLAPQAVLAGLATWVAVFLLTRYVSVASMLAAVAVAVAAWLVEREHGLLVPAALTLLAVVAILRHRSNIERLRAGTEHRFTFGRGRKAESPAP